MPTSRVQATDSPLATVATRFPEPLCDFTLAHSALKGPCVAEVPQPQENPGKRLVAGDKD